MKIYWTLKCIPELAGLPFAQRRRIWFRCYSDANRHWQVWVALGIMFACIVLPNLAIALLSQHITGMKSALLSGAVLGLLGAGVGIFVANQIIIRTMLPTLRKQLPGFCSSCGYDLTGNVSGVCPECGVATTSTG